MRAWPVVGHDGVVARLVDPPPGRPAGVVLVGPPGVGKTTLAAQAADALAERGHTPHWLRPTREMRMVPLGVLAAQLPPTEGTGPSFDHVARARAVLGSMAPAGSRLLLVVDDGHLLDELTSAVLHQCVAADGIRAIVTVRSGEAVPDSIVRLWKDDLLERVELGPLARDDLDRLLTASLGGPVDPALATEVWRRTGGNPLFVRELVGAGLDAGAVAAVDGVWQAVGPLSPSAALADLIRARLDALAGPAREAFELLVVGEPLDLRVLERLAPDPALVELERTGLLTVEERRGGAVVRLTHPLFGDVGEALLPVTRARSIKRRLAAAVGAAEGISDAERARVLRWQLDTGEQPMADELVVAAEAAMRTADMGLAERCGRLAFEQEPSVRTGLLLGRVLFRMEDHAAAGAVLARVEPLAATDAEVVAVAQSRSQSMAYGQSRYDDASAVLRAAGERVTDPVARDTLLCNEAALLLYTRRPVEALAAVAPLLDRAGGSVLANARLIAAVAHLLAGESRRCLDLVEQVAVMPPEGRVDPVGEGRIATLTGLLARLELGELDGAGDDARRTHERWSTSTQPVYGHWLAYALGRSELARGQATAAASWFHHAEQVGGAFAPDMLARWARGNRAYALVLAGRVDAARAALDEPRLADPGPYPDEGASRARAWVLVADGDQRGAVAVLESGAAAQAELGLYGFELTLRHDQVRLGVATAAVVDRLGWLAGRVDGPLADLRAAHATALAAGDADALGSVASGFAGLGALLHAAEAAAQAAGLARAGGRARTADALAGRGRTWMAACDVAPTPALAGLGSAAPLTARERSVAVLAATGTPSKEIAARLGISRRTVDNALQRVYEKLGVNSRRELADVLE